MNRFRKNHCIRNTNIYTMLVLNVAIRTMFLIKSPKQKYITGIEQTWATILLEAGSDAMKRLAYSADLSHPLFALCRNRGNEKKIVNNSGIANG